MEFHKALPLKLVVIKSGRSPINDVDNVLAIMIIKREHKAIVEEI